MRFCGFALPICNAPPSLGLLGSFRLGENILSCCWLVLPKFGVHLSLGRAEMTAVHSSVLQTELESCRMLLEEEPGNKCTFFIILSSSFLHLHRHWLLRDPFSFCPSPSMSNPKFYSLLLTALSSYCTNLEHAFVHVNMLVQLQGLC